MRLPKYPLELALKVRERKLDESARALAAAVKAREAAEHRKRSSQQRSETHRAEAARERHSEHAALARGELKAADLSTAASWEIRVAHERQVLAAELSEALHNETSARAMEQQAREEVTSRNRESKLVVDHRERWREGLQKRGDAKDEEASNEAWRPRANKKP